MSTSAAAADPAGRRRVALVGAGHAHLEVLLAAPAFAARRAELVLIDPGLFWYSGLATSMLGGRVRRDAGQINPARLAAAVGAGVLSDRVTGIDRARRSLRLQGGGELAYDLVSFNTGSVVHRPFATDGTGIWPVKPIAGLLELRQAVADAASPLTLLVVGGGPTGCEIAGNLARLSHSLRRTDRVVLLAGGQRLLPAAAEGAGARVLRELRKAGVDVRLSARVATVRDGSVRLEDGEALGFDHLVLATGLAADPLMGKLGLPFDRAGGLRVSAALHSPADARVFAAGDCADLEGHDLPKLGVYGVRAAPVLRDNLLAALDGRPLREYRPQRRALSILALGNGTGLALYGPLWWHGRPMQWWKDRIDRRFMERYRRLYP